MCAIHAGWGYTQARKETDDWEFLGESTGCTNLVVLTYEHVHKIKVSDWCRVAAVSVYHFLDCDRIRRKRPILGSIS